VKSEYLEWFKSRKPARFNLAMSAVLPYPLADLGVRIEDLEINSPSADGYPPLQEAIAGHCSAPAGCVVATSGASMANFIAMASLIQPGDEVMIERPAYEPLMAVARYLGAEVKRFDRGMEQPVELEALVSNRTKLIVLTNLHNPTCRRMDEPGLRDLAEIARSVGARVLADEVYLECMYDKKYSAFHQSSDFVCTGSLTKAYGLGGLRCGWILAELELARKMLRMKDLLDPIASHPAEKLSVSAFKRLDRIGGRARAIVETNRMLVRQILLPSPHIELSLPDYGTCIFPRLKQGNSDRFCELLHDEHDTDVVPGRFFEAPECFRIGIGGNTEILKAGLERLDTALRAMM
jgi:aspartate/methionine/tyrosine aminotransferase